MNVSNFKFQISNLFRISSFAFLILFSMMSSLYIALPVSAQFDPLEQACEGAFGNDVCEPGDTTDPVVGEEGIITRVTTILANITAIIAVIIIIVAGMTMVLSSGNSQQVQSSRDAIIYAAVALAVAVLARAVVLFVTGRLTGG